MSDFRDELFNLVAMLELGDAGDDEINAFADEQEAQIRLPQQNVKRLRQNIVDAKSCATGLRDGAYTAGTIHLLIGYLDAALEAAGGE